MPQVHPGHRGYERAVSAQGAQQLLLSALFVFFSASRSARSVHQGGLRCTRGCLGASSVGHPQGVLMLPSSLLPVFPAQSAARVVQLCSVGHQRARAALQQCGAPERGSIVQHCLLQPTARCCSNGVLVAAPTAVTAVISKICHASGTALVLTPHAFDHCLRHTFYHPHRPQLATDERTSGF